MYTAVCWIDDEYPGRLGVMARPRGGEWLDTEIRALRGDTRTTGWKHTAYHTRGIGTCAPTIREAQPINNEPYQHMAGANGNVLYCISMRYILTYQQIPNRALFLRLNRALISDRA